VLAVLEPSESASTELAFIPVIAGFRNNLHFHGCLLLGWFIVFFLRVSMPLQTDDKT
jgi:hypothetical protein